MTIATSRSAPRPSAIRDCCILLVDDEAANLDLLEALLEADGYTRLVRTNDARQVPTIVASDAPDLVLLDLHMPHRHGLDVLADLVAATPAGDYRPVLVLTADITSNARDRALALGARDFVTKPFDAAEVLLRVSNLLDTRVLHVAERRLRERAEAAEQEARTLLADAELATQERERLLAVVAHDLRNPLGAIAMYAEMLSSLQPDDSTVAAALSESELRVRNYTRTALDTIHTSAATMQHLVEDLLDASTLRRGALRIARSATPLATPVHDALRILTPAAAEAGVTLALDGPVAEGMGCIDAARCGQMLSNLLRNAITATPAGGRVSVQWTLAEGGDAVEGWVRDTGRGIAAAALPHLFTAFWRGDRRDRDGVGLGLWIARAIAEAHGGDLTVMSTEGAGATFHFVIPFADRARRRED